MKCRHCNTELKLPLIDLGSAPPSNAYLTEQKLHTPEKWFPWNLKSELIKQLSYITESGGKFVVAEPKLEII